MSDFKLKNMIAMWDSLNTAVEAAGGIKYNFDDHKDITLYELMSHLAQNNIRFIYVKPKKENLS